MAKRITMVAAVSCIYFAILVGVLADEPLGRQGIQTLNRAEDPVWPSLKFPVSGLWRSSYDSAIDGKLDPRESPLIEMSIVNNRISGHYQDYWAVGKENDSIFAGEIIAGDSPIILLRQDYKDGLHTIYTGRLVATNRFVGTYVGNRGNSADWSLELVTEEEAKDADGIERTVPGDDVD